MKTSPLRRTVSIAVLVVLAAVLMRLAWSRWGTLAAAEAKLRGRYPTEEQWIAGEIAQDILEMAQFARQPDARGERLKFAIEPLAAGQPGPGVAVSFSPAGKDLLRRTIRWQHHIWSPEDYEPLARAALDGRRPAAPIGARVDDEATLAALTLPLAGVIETQNQRVSHRLARSMLDAAAHEEAALVVGALALREAAGSFCDVRQLLCRMAAHLAMARALRGTDGYGLSGRYADAILASHAGRSTETWGKLEALEVSAGPSPIQRAWVRALRMSTTGDWRPLADPRRATLIERLTYFRVAGLALGRAAAYDAYAGAEAEPITDWGRIAFQGDFGTEVGGFAREGTEPELAEAREVWRRLRGRELPSSDTVEELNRPAAGCITPEGPRVLAWGTWAASFQRHLCHRALAIDRYWRHTVGMRDRAQAQLAAFDRELGGLALYPYVQAVRWHHGEIELESFSSGLNAAVSTTSKRPELVTAHVWDRTADTARYAVTRRRMPAPLRWFSTLAPAGTTYDAGSRVYLAGFAKAGAEPLAAARNLDPWNHGLNSRTIELRFGPNPTPEQIASVFGERADYDVFVVRWMASAVDGRSSERARLLRRACDLLADECARLARHLVAGRRDTEAADALVRAFEGAHDRVVLTHSLSFLVRHYHDRGQHAEAMRVAEEAADTYSNPGLQTMGLLMEWRGRFAEAEGFFQKAADRYEDSAPLAGFYHRMTKAGHRDYERKFEAEIRKWFPNGIEKLDTSRLPPVPTDGVHLSNPGPDGSLADIETGDVVVGLDGWRVHDNQQYQTVRHFDWRPDMRMHVWRKGKYLETAAHLMDRYLLVDVHPRPHNR